MPTHSNIPAWRIPWTKDPGRLQSMGSHRVGHDWSNLACLNTLAHPLIFQKAKLEVNEVVGFVHDMTRVGGGAAHHRGRAWTPTAQRRPDLHLPLCAPSSGPGTQRSPDKRLLHRLGLNPCYQHHWRVWEKDCKAWNLLSRSKHSYGCLQKLMNRVDGKLGFVLEKTREWGAVPCQLKLCRCWMVWDLSDSQRKTQCGLITVMNGVIWGHQLIEAHIVNTHSKSWYINMEIYAKNKNSDLFLHLSVPQRSPPTLQCSRVDTLVPRSGHCGEAGTCFAKLSPAWSAPIVWNTRPQGAGSVGRGGGGGLVPSAAESLWVWPSASSAAALARIAISRRIHTHPGHKTHICAGQLCMNPGVGTSSDVDSGSIPPNCRTLSERANNSISWWG